MSRRKILVADLLCGAGGSSTGRRDLVRAAALIIAEIEKLDRGETHGDEDYNSVYCECDEMPDEEELLSCRCKACGRQIV